MGLRLEFMLSYGLSTIMSITDLEFNQQHSEKPENCCWVLLCFSWARAPAQLEFSTSSVLVKPSNKHTHCLSINHDAWQRFEMIFSLQRPLEVVCNTVNLKVLLIVIRHSSMTLSPFLSCSCSFLHSLSWLFSLSIALSPSMSHSLPLFLFLSIYQVSFPPLNLLFSPAFFLFFSHFLLFTHFSVSLFPSLFISQRVSEVLSTQLNQHVPGRVSNNEACKIRVSNSLLARCCCGETPVSFISPRVFLSLSLSVSLSLSLSLSLSESLSFRISLFQNLALSESVCLSLSHASSLFSRSLPPALPLSLSFRVLTTNKWQMIIVEWRLMTNEVIDE